jgi:hypothetical protein
VIEDGIQYHDTDYDDELCWGGLHYLKLGDEEEEEEKPTRPSGLADRVCLVPGHN